jgi:hypothetical protein
MRFRHYFVIQSTFMDSRQESLDTLKDIKKMMERSSRFISLSGLSGVAAGICGLTGAVFAYRVIDPSHFQRDNLRVYKRELDRGSIGVMDYMGIQLVQIALVTFGAAMLLAFLFTWLRSRKTGTTLWGPVSRKLTFSMLIPMIIGGIYLFKLMEAGSFGLVAPGCLVFYGLALMNASRYTLDEIKWLGYAELATGVASMFYPGYGLYFWAFGFGILHIVYGLFMWYRYERSEQGN